MDGLTRDLRSAVRALRRSKGTTTVILATLATGIATVTTIFSFVNSALLRPPPYADAERTVAVSEIRRNRGSFSSLTLETAQALRGVRSFDRVGVHGRRSVKVVDPTRTQMLPATTVDTAVLSMLGVQPLRGRLPSTAEIVRGDPVVLISDVLWHERFAASDAILDQTITLDGIPHAIVGVAPPGFGFPSQSRLWLPLSERAAPDALSELELSAIARLRAGTSRDQARAEVDVVGKRLAASGRPHLEGISLVMRDEMVDRGSGAIAPLAFTFLGAAICVLLVACTNVANLMMVRAAERRTEMAVRASLGASRFRLIRQSLSESVVLGAIAGALGLLLTYWTLPIIVSSVPLGGMPSWVRIGIDGRVLAFTLGISMLTIIAFGVAPALAGSRLDPMRVLKSGSPAFSAGRRATRNARRGVVIELSLAVVLFVGAMMLTQTWRNLSVIDQGFDADRVFETAIVYDDVKHPDIDARMRMLDEVAARLLAHPAVAGVATQGYFQGLLSTAGSPDSTTPPSAFYRLYLPEKADTPADPGPEPRIWGRSVSETFFEVMGIPILRGRSFGAADGPGAAPVAVVSAEMARLVWPGEEALGRQIRVGRTGPLFTVIGIARDIRFTTSSSHGMQAGPKQSIYYSARQVDGGSPDLLVRARSDAELVPAAIQSTLRASDLAVGWGGPETLAARERDAMLGPRIAGAFMGTFAIVALLLAMLGIYGVLAYGVADRTREIGIRMALGGTARNVIALVVRDGMRFVALGLAIGVALSFAVTPLLRRFVWGVSVTDPAIFAVVLATFSAVALLGCWIPARRATNVQPMEALRQD